MASGEIDLSLVDSIDQNESIIKAVAEKFNKFYPNMQHVNTTTYNDDDKKYLIFKFTGIGSIMCKACDCPHILESKGIKVVYDFNTKNASMICPGHEWYHKVGGERKKRNTYIILSEDEVNGPIINNEENKFLYHWLINIEQISINRKYKGTGVVARPLYDRFMEYCKEQGSDIEKKYKITKHKFSKMLKGIIGEHCIGQDKRTNESIYFYLHY